MNIIRRHYSFFGTVQGVGFRYRAYHAAQHFGVGGWVRNCADGSVEMEAEGCPQDIEQMIVTIQNGHFIEIDDMLVKEIPPIGESRFSFRD